MITDFNRRATWGRCEEKWQNFPDGSSREYHLALTHVYRRSL